MTCEFIIFFKNNQEKLFTISLYVKKREVSKIHFSFFYYQITVFN